MVATATMLVAAVGTGQMAAAGPSYGATAAAKPTKLVLTVARGETTTPVQRRASLTCRPAGGSHKQARDACSALAKVGGNFTRLQVTGGACTMQYDPVTVTAVGRWKGKRVDYRKTYGNACALSTTTGPVFSL
ncbi:SSI family serine proteinase inhibitor [Dactylosporangium sp. NPDC050688]|uniref:SSI family serine proteinase inhibitor n=1 Tax=Dactylosporangium sp. NPDC050688 TaxID=3157217 RepID=UPI0033FF8E79